MPGEARNLDAHWARLEAARARLEVLRRRRLVALAVLLASGALGRGLGYDVAVPVYFVPFAVLNLDWSLLTKELEIARTGLEGVTSGSRDLGGRWEYWLATRAGGPSRLALPCSSAIAIGLAAVLAWTDPGASRLLVAWGLSVSLLALILHAAYFRSLGRVERRLDERRHTLDLVAAAAVQQGAGATGTLHAD